ncbi:hypothetical protein HD806DRAFT_502761 [Xylariaceae sp. AK1471]|nr:hypothetical protein HD806DRAFT_502761 [Xylariaceae sp. AK1471]
MTTIMVNPGGFYKALERFKKGLSDAEKNEFSICCLEDVFHIIRDIQNEQGMQGYLVYLKRLEPFIEAIEQLGKTIEVYLNADKLLCFIWGPIKLLLGVARTHLDSLDKLLNVYSLIGNAIPGLLVYKDDFEKHVVLQGVLEDYYDDILEFHRNALKVFRGSSWKKLFNSAWKRFDTNFQPIITSLKNRRELIESEKSSAMLSELHKLRVDFNCMRKDDLSRLAQEDTARHRVRMSRIREKLQPASYIEDHERIAEERPAQATGQWLFKTQEFQSWVDPIGQAIQVLYVHGIPGAGKSTLMSTAIESLLETAESLPTQGEIAVTYFYCRHNMSNTGPNRNSFNAILRALLDQLIDQNPILSHHFSEEISNMDGLKLRSTQMLEQLVHTAIKAQKINYLILDGLDECGPDQTTMIIDKFLSMLQKHIDEAAGTNFRVLFSGQRDGILDTKLERFPSVSLDNQAHTSDVYHYCEMFAAQIRQKRRLTDELEHEIKSKVFGNAKGMFLYAKVILSHLKAQPTLSRLRKELQPDVFPRDLEKAYERVARRIFVESAEASMETAEKILSYLICARRPLKWREIQSFFSIDPHKGDVDYEERSLRATAKELCGSLVDVHIPKAVNVTSGAEDVYGIVHESAKIFLIRHNHVNVEKHNAAMGQFLVEYLISYPFCPDMTENERIGCVQRGYYGLLEYAVTQWVEHVRIAMQLKSRALSSDLTSFTLSISRFLSTCYIGNSESSSEQASDISKAWSTVQSLPLDDREMNLKLDLEMKVQAIRMTIEMLREKDQSLADQAPFLELMGPSQDYKCPKPWCQSFSTGFATHKERTCHVSQHTLEYQCSDEECFGYLAGFDSASKLKQHRKNYHMATETSGHEFPSMKVPRTLPVCRASEKGDIDMLTFLLNQGGDHLANESRSSGETALYLAARNGHFKVCQLLIQKGADTDSLHLTKQGKETVLHAAVHSRDADVVRLIVSECQNLHMVDYKRRSPLFLACDYGLFEIVLILLSTEGLNVETGDEDGYTPFHAACKNGHANIVRHLLSNTSVDIASKCAENLEIDLFYFAEESVHSEVVEITSKCETVSLDPFYSAAVNGHGEVVDILIGTGRIVEPLNLAVFTQILPSYDLLRHIVMHPSLRWNKSSIRIELIRLCGRPNMTSIIRLLLARFSDSFDINCMGNRMGTSLEISEAVKRACHHPITCLEQVEMLLALPSIDQMLESTAAESAFISIMTAPWDEVDENIRFRLESAVKVLSSKSGFIVKWTSEQIKRQIRENANKYFGESLKARISALLQ